MRLILNYPILNQNWLSTLQVNYQRVLSIVLNGSGTKKGFIILQCDIEKRTSMLNKLDNKIRGIIDSYPSNLNIPEDVEDNPLVGYLKIFQNQSRAIFILYQGLIFAFSGFIFLLSLLIFNVLENNLIPAWGAISLGTIDIFLIWGVYKAVQELRRYRKKSHLMANKIFEYLRKDLVKLEKIKSGNIISHHSHNRLNPSVQKKSISKPKKYDGWDRQKCPKFHTISKMQVLSCPACQYQFEKSFEN